MSEHLAFLLRGLGSGGVFAALAMALVVTFRSSGVINFATGAVGLYTAETYAYLRRGELFVPFPGLPAKVELGGGLGLIPSMAIALVIAAALGLGLHVLVFRPLRNAPAVAPAVASVGVMIVLQAIIGIRLGTNPITTQPILPGGQWEVLGQTVRADRIWFAATIVAIAVVITTAFRFTRFGLATRAAAETERGALVTGLAPQRIAMANWAISSVVAGLAGILISPIVPIVPVSYTLFIVPALAAALLGGFTSLALAVAGGLAIGMVQSELLFLQSSHDWLPSAGTPELVPLLLILTVLVLRGRPLPTRGALVLRTLGRAPRPTRIAPTTVVSGALGVFVLLATSGSYRAAVILSFIYGVIALSWVVVTGYAGQISLAQLSLAGVGAFSLQRLVDAGVPFPIAPLLAGAVAMVIGVLIGLPALRIRGLPVAVVTLALAVSLEAVWFLNPDLNGGLSGASISAPSFLGADLRVDVQSSRIAFGLTCLVALVITAAAVALLRTSRLGGAMLAVKANERSAAAAGVSVARTKVLAFAIGSFIAGFGGSLLAYQQGAAIPQTYGAVFGLGFFTIVYLSGITSVAGGVQAGLLASGGLVFVALERNLQLGRWYPAISGAFLIFTVIRHPEGLAGIAGGLRDRLRKAAPPPELRTSSDPSSVDEPGERELGPAVLRIEGVTVDYGGIRAVDGVAIDVQRGAIVGLIGPNGAGKTTLIDAISGYASCRGSVHLDGACLDGLRPHQRARAGLGRTFQGMELYEDLTVAENVRVGQEAAHRRREDDPATDDVVRIMDLLHLTSVGDRPVSELSAGHRQLVSIARALAGRPTVVLLDEPAGGLDTDESRWLGEQLHRVRDAGITVVLIDHDMSLVLSVCDTVHVLDLGQIIASGPPAQVRGDARVAEAYLGTTHAEPVETGP